jgi:DNA-binding response OmpR family regulator
VNKKKDMHILIVEDEAGIVQFLQQGLEEEGYQITSASDGLQGFELIQKAFEFDSFGLDVTKMSGLDLCKAIRKKDTSTPILFFTARTQFKKQLKVTGANDYIRNHLVLKNYGTDQNSFSKSK